MTLLLLSPRAASAFRFSACSRVSPGRAGSIAAHSRVAVCRFDSLAVRAAPATKRFAQCVLLKYCCDCGALARICAAGVGKKAQLITHRDINSTEAGRLSLAVMPKT